MLDRRKTERMFLRIPVMVKGVAADGSAFTEDTSTVEINRDGARVGLSNPPRPGSDLEITNQANKFTAIFQPAGQCPQSYDGLPEWGVEMSAPIPDFWGIVFEEKTVEDQPGVSALLTCQVCGRQEIVSLTPAEYETLRTKLFLGRLCAGCRIVARWEVGSPGEGTSGRAVPVRGAGAQTTASGTDASAVADGGAASAGKAASEEKSAAERRGARRLALKVPILVKLPSGESEETETSDLSKTGLSFTCGLNIAVGDVLQIIVGYGVAESAPAQSARVVWRRPEKKNVRALVGVRFE